MTTLRVEDLSDAALVERSVDGDQAAFEALVRRHSPGLFRMLVRLARNPQIAEDALQETWFVAVRKLASIEAPDAVHRWLRMVALNQIRHRDATNRVERDQRQLGGLRDGDGEFHPELADSSSHHVTLGDDPAEVFEVIHGDPELDRAMRRLPPQIYDAMVLYYGEGWSQAEIAASLDVSEGTVASWLSRGRTRLREQLGGERPRGQMS